MAKDFNEALDDINFAEQRRHRQMGFTRGYSVGEEAGWRDGYVFGIRKGSQISAEIGYYQGFTHAWISILEKEDLNKQRKLTALRTLLDMTRNFPKTNLLEEDTIQKLGRIRAKFKQCAALISGTNAYMESGSFGGSSWTSMDSGQGTYSGTYSTTGSVRGSSPNPPNNMKGGEMSF
ncbi:protein LTO1 homolog [Oppia nitens]|uniref:protein LTO1 homolog n=1 Tax=Oppia nitens TaxID=1686743 RepID=UPI0023DBD709|nr:protein LTO1 homolog [Oppia nitens]